MNKNSNEIPLTVVIITLNEEANIARALDSVKWAREVIVYDSGSTDLTLEIAQKLGAKVICGPWLGFGPTKRKATALAIHDWILSIDADELVTEALAAEIKQKFLELKPEIGYELPRLSNYLGHWVRFGGWYPDYQLRLFNRQFSNWNEAEIHEKVICARTLSLTNSLNHYVFKSIDHQVQTNNRYSTLLAQQMFEKQKSFSWFHWITKPSVKFFECYIFKLGFLDGWVGYLIARNAAYSVFLKWSKLKELKLSER
jgi:glycosyltransferase involved in cell wall biosynthesis